jgi:CHAT domain-containing protein/Tfp pilus assembly protein PilF
LDTAAKKADQAMSRAAKTDPVWSYKFRILKAEIIVLRNPGEAVRLLELPPPAELSAGEFAARREITLGLAYSLQKNYPQAKSCFENAERAAGESELVALVAFDRAFVARMEKDDKAAEAYYKTAITLAERFGLKQAEADARINLGKVFMDRELYDQATNQFNLSLGPARSAQAAASGQAALGNLGWSYFQIGDFGSAATSLTKAVELAAQIKNRSNQELWLRDLGILSYVQANYSEAETYYQKSLALSRQLRDENTIAINYHNLAQLELKRGNVDKAEDYNRLAYAAKGLHPEDRSDPYLLLTSAEIAQVRKELSKAEQYLIAVIHSPNADSSLRWQAQSDLASLYVAQGDNVKAEALFLDALHTVEAARSGIKLEDRRMSVLDAWPFYDDYIRFLVNQGNEEKALQIAEFSRGRTLAEAFGIGGSQDPAGLRLPAVRSFLRRKNQTILAYWISSQESYLWVIGPATFKLFRLPAQERIDRAINSYNNEIRDHEEAEESARGQALYEMLIRPAEALLPPHAQVVIVPNRSLYKLNFESLVVPGKAPHYWIEDTVIESASSIALLVKARRQPAGRSKKLLLMGAPVQETEEFPSLRFAAEEMQSVAHHFPRGQATILAGKEATPSAYGAAGPGGYQFIHLVTHGTASPTSPLDSAIILSSDPDKSFKLYARNIKDIGPLHAELVTISACYGAGERAYSGEGLVGLAWAFMRAGSHQVVAALWEVGDSTMPRLMDKFYSDIELGRSVPQALRTAKLAILHSRDFHKKPYYWASLQLYTGS